MVFLKKIFEFYILSNIHVSFAAFCLVKITLFEYGINDDVTPLFVFFATIISYNFIRVYKIDEINFIAATWIRSNKKVLLVLNVISLLLLGALLFKLDVKEFILLTPLFFATVFYVIPFSSKKNLRKIAGFKLFLITFTWACVTVLFPLFHSEVQFSNSVWILFLQRFLFFIAVIIPFDIRDMNLDSPEIKTLPHTIGIKGSKLVGSIALLLFLVLEFFRVSNIENSMIITFIIAIISFSFLINSGKNQNRFYSSFWVEALPILWFLLIYFTNE